MLKVIVFISLILSLAVACEEPEQNIETTYTEQIEESPEAFVLRHGFNGDTVETNFTYPPLDTGEYRPTFNRYVKNPSLIGSKKDVIIPSNTSGLSILNELPVDIYAPIKKDTANKKIIQDPKVFTIPITEIPVIEPQQEKALPWVFKDAAQYEIECLTVDQGLPSNNINVIFEDSRGFKWFGTDKGLVKFDGITLKTYNLSSGIPDEDITEIVEDKDGNLWLGTAQKGLVKFDGRTYFHLPTDSIRKDYDVNDIAIDENNDVWALVRFGGLIRYDGEKVYHYGADQGLHTNRASTSLTFDKDGVLWISAHGWGLYRLVNEKIEPIRTNTGYTNDAFFNKEGDLMLTMWTNRFMQYHDGIETDYALDGAQNSSLILNIEQDSRGRIWMISYDDGLYMIDGNIVHRYSTKEGISGQYIGDFHIDASDKIWIATYGGGISRFNPNSYDCLNRASGLETNNVNDVAKMHDGTWVYATQEGFYIRKDSLYSKITKIGNPSNLTNARNIETTYLEILLKGDTIWTTAVNQGITMIFGEHATRMGGNMGEATNPISLAETKDGTIWVGSMNQEGLAYIKNDSLWRYFNKNSIALVDITKVYCDSKDNVWIGTDGRGLAKINDNGITYYSTNEGLPDNTIVHLFEDSKGVLWISTANGIGQYENEKFKKITTSHPKLNGVISSVNEDKYGRYWIGSKEGLLVLIPRKEISEDFNLAQYYTYSIDRRNGLLNQVFIAKSSRIIEDRIYMGTEGGLMSWNINETFDTSEVPKIYIDKITVNEIPINPHLKPSSAINFEYSDEAGFSAIPTRLTLASDYNNISIDYSCIYWTAPRLVEFEYYLEGYETNWKKGNPDHRISYTNLDYGTYNIHLKATVPYQCESEELIYAFEILRPWYHTWWARICFGVLIVFVGYLIIRMRTQQLKKRQIELETEVSNATLEIRAQKDEIETAHHEIKDSISYAKRIQSAILPHQKLVKSYMPNSFILYKPKDIVAGDFYWMEPYARTAALNDGTEESGILFAAADCTGHGVPGAMVSVICNNALNRAVREKGITNPGLILDETRNIIIQEFAKSEEEVKDGMDIALCALSGNTLYYAGANNPLWIIRKGSEEIEEIKADKQPIGKFDFAKPFTTHTIQLNPGDQFYIFSDGYSDQFGGEKGKKMKGANFKKLLLENKTESPEKQREIIDNAFEKWKGTFEQVDDVCVIGVLFMGV